MKKHTTTLLNIVQFTPAQIAKELVDLSLGDTLEFGDITITKGVEQPGTIHAKYVYLVTYRGREKPVVWYFGGAFRAMCEESLTAEYGKLTVGNWLNGD